MKITHVLPALTKGGAEKVVVDLANASSMIGHEVTVLVGHPVDPNLLRNRLSASVRVRTICDQPRPLLARYAQLIPWSLRNWQWIREQDVVHCHLTLGGVVGTIIWCVRGLTRAVKPVVIETNHSVGMPIKKWQTAAFKVSARWRDGYALMAENSEWRRHLQKRGMPLSQFIPNGVEVPRQGVSPEATCAFSSRVGLPSENVPVVGTIGRLVAERNPLAMLDVFAEIQKGLAQKGITGTRGAHFLMGGEGPEMEPVRQKAHCYKIADRVHLPGLIVNPQLAMSTMDLYVSLNVGGTTGIAGMEAAAQGVPVIALQMSADYESSDSDWIWSSKDPKALAAKAVELLLSDSFRTEIGRQQREHVIKNFSAEKMAADYGLFYSLALSRAEYIPPGVAVD
jgi:glycosyltransferase involved in cell wall biosynthesis